MVQYRGNKPRGNQCALISPKSGSLLSLQAVWREPLIGAVGPFDSDATDLKCWLPFFPSFCIFRYGHERISVTAVNKDLKSRLNPAVPRRYLFMIAAVLWTLAGGLLCVRGVIWLDVFSFPVELGLEAVSMLIAIGGYVVLFSKVVQANVGRISRLPERSCVFAFSAWRGYLMIALMMSIGIALRGSTMPKYVLSIPYTAMGGALLIGSARFYREFLGARAKAQS